jgi:hypothetical protein
MRGECSRKKKDKAESPIIQFHIPSLIAESGLLELVLGFCRILFGGTVTARGISLEFNHAGFFFLLIKAEMKYNLMGHHILTV